MRTGPLGLSAIGALLAGPSVALPAEAAKPVALPAEAARHRAIAARLAPIIAAKLGNA
jgi:hypothetical protein